MSMEGIGTEVMNRAEKRQTLAACPSLTIGLVRGEHVHKLFWRN
jgi:hypothetical protein